MIKQPRFRKGKKFAKATHRTPKQEKMYRRYLAGITLFKIKRHAQAQTAIQMSLAVASVAMTYTQLSRIRSMVNIGSPQEKAIVIAQGLINGYQSIAKAFEFRLPQPV